MAYYGPNPALTARQQEILAYVTDRIVDRGTTLRGFWKGLPLHEDWPGSQRLLFKMARAT